MATLEEIEGLIARVALGDRSAFAELYTLTSAKLFGICLRVLDNRPEAEDALQEIFVKIWRNADKYRANGLSPMTWLITVARNHAIDRLRARRAAGRRDARDLASAEEVADAAARPRGRGGGRARNAARLDGCLGELPRRPGRGGARRLPGRGDLCRAGGALRRAAEHDADLAAAQPDEAEGVPVADERAGAKSTATTAFWRANTRWAC